MGFAPIAAGHRLAVGTGFWLRYGATGYGRAIRYLEHSQWFAADQLRELQWSRLKRLLDHAYRTVPYYRAMFAQVGATPADIKDEKDFARLPVLTKKAIQEHLPDLISAEADRSQLIENHTGGSTGQPLTFYQDRYFQDWTGADKFRCYRLAGWTPGAPWCFWWGSNVDGAQHGGWKRRLDRFSMNLVWVNTFGLYEAQLPQYIRTLEQLQPQLIVGYVSSLRVLCHYIRDNDLSGRIRPVGVQTSAEALSPADRALFGEALQCQVFDRYGGREFSNVAHECEAHEGLHVLAENNYVEILDGERVCGPGESGRVVVTGLCNLAMPFIRYEMGDVARLASHACSCGRQSPLIAAIEGRSSDFIVCPSGKLIHGEAFTHLFYEQPSVHQFQVVQPDLNNLIVRLALRPESNSAAVQQAVDKAMAPLVDPDQKIRYELCDAIPPAASGKRRFVISDVAAPHSVPPGVLS